MLFKKYSCLVSGFHSVRQCVRNGIALRYLTELRWITPPVSRPVRKMCKALVWGTPGNIFSILATIQRFIVTDFFGLRPGTTGIWFKLRVQCWFSRPNVNHLKLMLLVRSLLFLRLFLFYKRDFSRSGQNKRKSVWGYCIGQWQGD